MKSVLFWRDDAWSPSCRYFAFDIGSGDDGGIVLWDTVAQKAIGTFKRTVYKALNFLAWGETDNYVILNAFGGQFIWKILSNEQIKTSNDRDWWYFWDTPHHQVFWWDGRYFVDYDLNTGKALRKFISPFMWNQSDLDLSSDGKTLTIRDRYVDMWSVTWDRTTGKIINAQAEGNRRSEEVQFSPDRRFITVAENAFSEECWPVTFIYTSGYSWHFVDASTLELVSQKDGKQYLFDLLTKRFRGITWSPIFYGTGCYA